MLVRLDLMKLPVMQQVRGFWLLPWMNEEAADRQAFLEEAMRFIADGTIKLEPGAQSLPSCQYRSISSGDRQLTESSSIFLCRCLDGVKSRRHHEAAPDNLPSIRTSQAWRTYIACHVNVFVHWYLFAVLAPLPFCSDCKLADCC